MRLYRSPMAEFVMKDLLAREGIANVSVESAALHTDEIGNDIHNGTRRELEKHGVPYVRRAAWLLDAAPPRIDHVENVPLFGPNWRFW